MAKIPLAVIGYGNIAGNNYGPILHTVTGRVELAALVEPDEERRERAAGTYGFAKTFASVDEMLTDVQPQAALVLVPAPIHREITPVLLEAGVDVYTEKPDTYSLAEAREFVALAQRKGCVYQVGQNRLFMTALTRAKEFFADDPVDFIHVEKSKTVCRTDPEYLLDDGIHVVSPMVWLAGDVDSVLSAVHIPERLLSAHFKLTSGGAATLTQHVDDGYWVERFLAHAKGKSANVVTPDTVELYQKGTQVGSTHVGRCPLLFTPASLFGFQAALSHFLDCVESRREPTGSAARLLRVHEIMNEVFNVAGIPTL